MTNELHFITTYLRSLSLAHDLDFSVLLREETLSTWGNPTSSNWWTKIISLVNDGQRNWMNNVLPRSSGPICYSNKCTYYFKTQRKAVMTIFGLTTDLYCYKLTYGMAQMADQLGVWVWTFSIHWLHSTSSHNDLCALKWQGISLSTTFNHSYTASTSFLLHTTVCKELCQCIKRKNKPLLQ